jgi:hypothetical protein
MIKLQKLQPIWGREPNLPKRRDQKPPTSRETSSAEIGFPHGIDGDIMGDEWDILINH